MHLCKEPHKAEMRIDSNFISPDIHFSLRRYKALLLRLESTVSWIFAPNSYCRSFLSEAFKASLSMGCNEIVHVFVKGIHLLGIRYVPLTQSLV